MQIGNLKVMVVRCLFRFVLRNSTMIVSNWPASENTCQCSRVNCSKYNSLDDRLKDDVCKNNLLLANHIGITSMARPVDFKDFHPWPLLLFVSFFLFLFFFFFWKFVDMVQSMRVYLLIVSTNIQVFTFAYCGQTEWIIETEDTISRKKENYN